MSVDVPRRCDVCRQAVVFAGLDGVARGLRWALADPEVEVLRVKNRFGRAYDARLTAGARPPAARAPPQAPVRPGSPCRMGAMLAPPAPRSASPPSPSPSPSPSPCCFSRGIAPY